MRKYLVIALTVACLAASGPATARKAGGAQQDYMGGGSSVHHVVAEILSYFGIRI